MLVGAVLMLCSGFSMLDLPTTYPSFDSSTCVLLCGPVALLGGDIRIWQRPEEFRKVHLIGRSSVR